MGHRLACKETLGLEHKILIETRIRQDGEIDTLCSIQHTIDLGHRYCGGLSLTHLASGKN